MQPSSRRNPVTEPTGPRTEKHHDTTDHQVRVPYATLPNNTAHMRRISSWRAL